MGKAIIVEPLDGTILAPFGSLAPSLPADLGNDWIGVNYTSSVSTGSDVVDIDFGSARSVDTVAFLSANYAAPTWFVLAGPTQASASAYNGGSITFEAGSVPATSLRANSFLRLGTPVSARWVRATLQSLSTNFQAGRLVVGNAIEQAYNFNFGAAFGVRDLGGGDFSAQGVFLPKPGKRLRTIGLSFTRTTRQEMEELIGPLLERIGNGKFVLVVTDPDASPQRLRRMYFGPLSGDLSMIWATSNGFEWRANLVSVI